MLLLIVSTLFSFSSSSLPGVELSLLPEAPDAVIMDGASSEVTIKLQQGDSKDGAYEVRQYFTDRYGIETKGATLPADLKQVWTHKAVVPVEYYGATEYRVEVFESETKQPIATQRLWLVKPVPLPELTKAERIASPIGINTHDGAHWQTLKAFGVHWARDYSWGWLRQGKHIPKAANHTDFGKKLEAIQAAGIEVLPVMQRAFRTKDNRFFIPWGDVIQESYERLSKGFPDILYWELDNESNLQHRDETTEDYQKYLESYVKYIRMAYAGLQDAGNGAKVVLDGEAGIHPVRARYLLEQVGDYYSVVNYHYYTGTVAPEIAERDINTGAEDRPQTVSFLDIMREMNQLAKDHGKETWLSEIAWSAEGGPEVGYRYQAAYLHRIYLLAAWAGTDKVFWFWDRNLGGQGRFSGTGLIDMETKPTVALPVGAAMAGISKFIARARYAGSVDIGHERWCLLFERPEGGWLVAAWAVGTEFPLPSELENAKESFDLYGNPLRDRRLSDDPAYFYLSALPDEWESQRQVQLLSTSTINIYQGDDATVEVRAGGDIKLRFADLPSGVQVGEWTYEDNTWVCDLSANPTLPAAIYSIQAVASDKGWEKRFTLRLVVRPAVSIRTMPYTPGKPSSIEATLLIPKAVEATFSTPEELGTMTPDSLELESDQTKTLEFTATSEDQGPIQLTSKLSNGGTQVTWIRPRILQVPKAGNIQIDGSLDDWPKDNGILTRHSLLLKGLETGFDPKMRLAWSSEGLYVAAQIPVGMGLKPPAKPEDFWEWTGLEMNLNAADVKTEPGAVRPHLLYFVPTQDGKNQPWRLFAGEWNKQMPDGSRNHLKDDIRTKNAVIYEGGMMTLEIFIPDEVLEASPEANEIWRMTINAKISRALSPKTVATWPAGPGKGWESWGMLIFED
ncbi:hypothetical protein GCM10007047_19220 [Cerasicoccus arenae]|uniref:Carbohydrate-binding domain-containing protein n=2 Tax=Cerasicoccus arenae TaxID=424488 RepID=A0A8J3DCD5_9BACT|nr:hypothetical protein GCM10007047_19220 [Cerasicoccus arenae]